MFEINYSFCPPKTPLDFANSSSSFLSLDARRRDVLQASYVQSLYGDYVPGLRSVHFLSSVHFLASVDYRYSRLPGTTFVPGRQRLRDRI
eukprot:scaffold421376_cov52-Attheya_sp.AAC.2